MYPCGRKKSKLFCNFWIVRGFARIANVLAFVRGLERYCATLFYELWLLFQNCQPVFGIQLVVDFGYRLTPVDIGGGSEVLNVDYKFIIAAQNLFNILNGRVLYKKKPRENLGLSEYFKVQKLKR